MGGLQGIPASLEQPDIQQTADQVRQQRLAQAAFQNPQINQQAQGQQPQGAQQPQQGQQPDPQIEALRQRYIQQATPVPAPTGGPVRQALQGFFKGAEQNMMARFGVPTDIQKQQNALHNLTMLDASQNTMAATRATIAEHTPSVPMMDIQGNPVKGQDGNPILMAPIHAETYYQGLNQQKTLAQIQGMKNDAANPILTPQQAQAIGRPELAGQEFGKAMAGIMGQQVKGDTAETVQNLRNQGQAAQTASKLDIFHQSQVYNTWKTQFEGQNKLQIAQMSAGKAPGPMLQTAAFAQSGLNRLDDAQQAMQRLESRGVLGNVASNKLENWIFGNGLVDPTLPAQDKEDIGRLRAAASYTSSAAMRAHTGRTSREIYDDFKNTMGINQGPDAWKGAMGETRSMLNDYAQGATNAAVQKLRGGGPTQVTAPTASGFARWKAGQPQ